jgi:hypothetical protein
MVGLGADPDGYVVELLQAPAAKADKALAEASSESA